MGRLDAGSTGDPKDPQTVPLVIQNTAEIGRKRKMNRTHFFSISWTGVIITVALVFLSCSVADSFVQGKKSNYY